MDFTENLYAMAAKVAAQKSAIENEEATKTALVMPFISTVLGYDVFNPLEVAPEFTADVGLKRGEKIDYAILRDGEVQLLIECKPAGAPLSLDHASQLFRYFGVTNARIAVLTNGETYQFYTDLDSPNKMDARPFLVLALNDIDEALIPELRKLTKANFDLPSIINAAEELKYVGAIKRAVATDFQVPSDEWIKYLTAQVYEGSFTQRVREQFTPLVGKALQQYLSDQVNERLKTALGTSTYHPEPSKAPDAPFPGDTSQKEDDQPDGITTTLEELEAYHIVKAIACSEVKPWRVAKRDAKSYFAILLDDNNRKPIARLHFNGKKQKYIGLFDSHKVETRHPVDSLDEIYHHADALRSTVRTYMN